MNQSQHVVEGAKSLADYVAVGTTVGTVLGLLPYIAALFTIIWTGLRIYFMIRDRKDKE